MRAAWRIRAATSGRGPDRRACLSRHYSCDTATQAFRDLGTRFLQLPLGEVEPVVLGARDLVAGARR